MPCKLVLFYEQQQRGWSETWYFNSSVPKGVIREVCKSDFLTAAVTFRHPLTYLRAARATNIGSPKLSYAVDFGYTYKGSTQAIYVEGPDVCSTDAVVAVDAPTVGRKRMFIRGLNDEDVKRSQDGTDVPTGYLRAGLINYLNAAAAKFLALRRLVQPPDSAQTWYPVISVKKVVGDIPHSDIITLDPVAAPIAANTIVRFSRTPFNDLPGFPSSAKVLVMNPNGENGIRINYYLREQATTFTKSMQLTSQIFDYPIIDRVQQVPLGSGSPLVFERFSEHKTGRPFNQLRGRARSKVRAQ